MSSDFFFERFLITKLCAALIFFMVGMDNPLEARADSDDEVSTRCLVGTFLIEEGSGTKGLWTFNKDGNFIGASSAQPLLNFSALQGVWKKTGRRTVTATVLDFSFDDQGNLLNIARVDIFVRGNGKKCHNVDGEFSLRFFEDGEDPLKPETDTGQPFLDLFTGQRITVN